jgi:hypothetical protein
MMALAETDAPRRYESPRPARTAVEIFGGAAAAIMTIPVSRDLRPSAGAA